MSGRNGSRECLVEICTYFLFCTFLFLRVNNLPQTLGGISRQWHPPRRLLGGTDAAPSALTADLRDKTLGTELGQPGAATYASSDREARETEPLSRGTFGAISPVAPRASHEAFADSRRDLTREIMDGGESSLRRLLAALLAVQGL